MSDRFVVSSVSGYWIDAARPPSSMSGHKRPIPVSYYVLDRLDNYEIVAEFTATPRGHHRGNELRRELAELACARWNAWDDEEAAA
jgi:hypothetical protein